MKLSCMKCLCFFVLLGLCNAETNKKYYRAAVHELVQYDDKTSTGREIIDKNLGKYAVAAQLAASNDVDIIIFPEKGLFPMKLDNMTWFLNYAEDIPDGSEEAYPCGDEKYLDKPILKNLSCLAEKHGIFVVATLIDVKKCQIQSQCNDEVTKNYCVTNSADCPDSGNFKFNALVAFNRKGVLVARYYKRHPFAPIEDGITTPKYPQAAYFDTDFGLFACDIGFDFFYNESIIDLQRRPATTAIAYGNWWFDHTPMFYFSVPNQQAFCLTNKVTVLSSDVHSPNLGSLGSGIYIPDKGAVIYSYNPDGRSKLLISNVPTSFSDASSKNIDYDTKFFYIDDDDTISKLNGEEPRNFKEQCGENVLGTNPSSLTDYRCKQTEVQQYSFARLFGNVGNIAICSNNFCCDLEYQTEYMNDTFYFGVSGSRLKFYDTYWLGVQSCFLARCEPVNGRPCRDFRLKSNTKFQSIKITGHFGTSHIYPHILDSDLRLTDRDEWNFDGISRLSYKNLKGKNLLFANLYGRKFENDGFVHK